MADSAFILVTVKSQDLEPAMSAAAAYLGSATVISIQNGINDEKLRQHVDVDRLVMGMTDTNIARTEPGVVSLQLAGRTIVGRWPDGANAKATQTAVELLRKTGMPVSEHPNVLGVRYSKLAANALGYASCISGSNFITEALCVRAWRQTVGLPIVNECLATYRESGIDYAKIPRRPDVAGLARLMRLLDVPLVGSALAAAARRLYNRKPIVFSLYQDLLRGKATEVEYINGHIVRLAAQLGREAPCNALVVKLVRDLEQRGGGQFFSRDEVIHRFQQRRCSDGGCVTGP
jgi:2-dehydropantoate 2-reductase